MRSASLLLFTALIACKLNKTEEAPPTPTPVPDPEPVLETPPEPAVTSTGETSCARLGLYYTLKGGVTKGGVNISCDGKCNDIEEIDGGEKLKYACHVSCSAIGTQASKFAGALNVKLDLNRSDKDFNRYGGTISDGKSAPNVVSLTYKQKYTEANGQMTEKSMRWSMTLRPCK